MTEQHSAHPKVDSSCARDEQSNLSQYSGYDALVEVRGFQTGNINMTVQRSVDSKVVELQTVGKRKGSERLLLCWVV